MENEVKQRNQRNRRRERAQRMQAQRESKVKDGDSGEDESPAREKPPRPPARRKKSREPLGEEDIIDGFAIMAFRTYEDLEAAIKCATTGRPNSLSGKPRLPLAPLAGDAPRREPAQPQPNANNAHGITLLHDAGTSDDSGRASERLTGSSVAPRDPDSSRDRLSDASSRCSSGKGYICDSEGDDDKASPDHSRNGSPRYHDASMEDISDGGPLFRVAGAGAGVGAKNELVARGGSGGALALSRAPVGGSASPAPAPLPQPAPSPAPAALPPPALPPPPFRAEASHRQNGAHIPALPSLPSLPSLDAHAATQLPARPAGAVERPAAAKLQTGARAAADSPTPAPPAPPAPSPHFTAHAAYQPHAALPDYRHTNHDARTKTAALDPPPPAPGPLNLQSHPHLARPPHLHAAHPAHAAHPVHPAHPPHPTPASAAHPSLSNHAPHAPPHTLLPAHDVRNSPAATANHPSVPTSYPNHIGSLPAHATGISHHPASVAHPMSSSQSGLPNHGLSHLAGRPASPSHAPRAYAPPLPIAATGSSHTSSTVPSSITNHSHPYQSQNSSLHKHSVQSIHGGRPSHLPAFGPPLNHISGHLPPATMSHSISQHAGHGTSNHSGQNHSLHPTSNSLTHPTGHQVQSQASALPHGLPNYSHSHRPSSLHLQNHISAVTALPSTPVGHNLSNHHMDPPAVVGASPGIVPVTNTAGMHSLLPGTLDTRQTPASELASRTESPAVATSLATNGYPPPVAAYAGAAYPPLYAPYATSLQHSPYLPPSAASPRNAADTRTSLSASPLVAPKTPKGVRPHTPGSTGGAGTAPPPAHAPLAPLAPHAPLPPHAYSPRGHSPNRERDSYSSNISSLSRASGGTPVSSSATIISSAPASLVNSTSVAAAPLVPPLTAPLAAPLAVPLVAPLVAPLAAPLATPLATPLTTPLAAPTPTPATPAASHLAHSLAPVPTVPSISSSTKPPAHWGVSASSAPERPHGFPPAPPLFAAPLPPPNPNPNPNPFSAESLFQTSPSADLLRRELDNRFLAAAGGAFSLRTEMHHHQHQHTHVHQHPAHAPPPHHHLFAPPPPPLFKDMGKMASLYRHGLGLGYPYSSGLLHPSAPFAPPTPLSTFAPKPVVAAGADPTKPARPPTVKTGKWNAMHVRIAWEIYNAQQKGGTGGSSVAPGALPATDKDKLRAFPAPAPPPAPYRSPYDLPPAPYLPPHHPHLGISPFARYGAGAFPGAPPPFGLSPYAREMALSSPLHGAHHPSSLAALHEAWRAGVGPPRAPPPVSTAAHAEARREHEERERGRREREERERRDRDDRERRKQRERELERVRQRSPLRNGAPEQCKEERKEPPRPPPPLAYPPPAWDPYRGFDPLQHMRFTPIVEAAIRAEEERAKMLSAYAAHHQQLKPASMLHRSLPPHAPLPPLGPHAPLAPMAPLDLLKKEEPR